VKGGVGKIIEYAGPGLKTLSVPQRATITNMGAELGATTSLFPSDEVTREFLKLQKRPKDWKLLEADPDATYDEVIELDLSKIEPLIAQPHSPDNVIEVKKLRGIKVQQVAIGSCTNSSYTDLMTVARVLRKHGVHKDVSLCISPGSKQVLQNITANGALTDIISAGARVLECTCGPCIGMGQAPSSDAVSLRTFNRNFLGRSGTKSAQVYLCSPETAVAAAIYGEITDPRKLGAGVRIKAPVRFIIDDSMILPPSRRPDKVEIVRGPNIKPLPINEPLPDALLSSVLLQVEDNITTDHIMPAGAKILPLRSNIPAISEYVFSVVDAKFASRAKAAGGGFVVGGENYGQGSSREHAALGPMYLGIRAVMTKSFARIHQANLINFGILPLQFKVPADYGTISPGDRLELPNVKQELQAGKPIRVNNTTKGREYLMQNPFSKRQRAILMAGGLLNYTKQSA